MGICEKTHWIKEEPSIMRMHIGGFPFGWPLSLVFQPNGVRDAGNGNTLLYTGGGVEGAGGNKQNAVEFALFQLV